MFINSSNSISVSSPYVSFSNSSTSISSNSFNSLCLIASNVIYTIFTLTNILLLFPLYIFILYMGFQHSRHQRLASAGTTMSHSDFFTCNMMILEIFGVFGSVSYTVGNYIKSIIIIYFGVYLSDNVFLGQTMFHLLTCMERYLAVVHPITYMHLRETHGVRIRNISTMCVWLLCVGWCGVKWLYWPDDPMELLLSYLGVCIVVVIFCCLSVLHVLNRPVLGEVGRNKGWVDQSKRRAFHMIMVIMAVLLLKFVGILICCVIEYFSLMDIQGFCFIIFVVSWLSVPSSLVLPLLFLHRAGKLSCCRMKTESG